MIDYFWRYNFLIYEIIDVTSKILAYIRPENSKNFLDNRLKLPTKRKFHFVSIDFFRAVSVFFRG